MNTNTLNEAKKLEEEINSINKIIGDISYRHHSTRKDIQSKRYDWMLRLFNQKKEDGTKVPRMILFDNDHMHGSDIPVEEELLLMIKGYFENKLKVKEQEFNELT